MTDSGILSEKSWLMPPTPIQGIFIYSWHFDGAIDLMVLNLDIIDPILAERWRCLDIHSSERYPWSFEFLHQSYGTNHYSPVSWAFDKVYLPRLWDERVPTSVLVYKSWFTLYTSKKRKKYPSRLTRQQRLTYCLFPLP